MKDEIKQELGLNGYIVSKEEGVIGCMEYIGRELIGCCKTCQKNICKKYDTIKKFA